MALELCSGGLKIVLPILYKPFSDSELYTLIYAEQIHIKFDGVAPTLDAVTELLNLLK